MESGGRYLKRDDAVQTKREKLFHEFATGVTLHGFRYIFDEQHVLRRIIWFLLLVSTATLSIVLFYGIFMDYIQFKTVTTMNKQYNLTNEIAFPTTTLCPYNSKSESKLRTFLKYFNMPSNTIDIMRDKSFLDVFDHPDLRPFYQKLLDSNLTIKDMAVSLEWNYHDMTFGEVVSTMANPPCKFYGKPCNGNDFKSVRTWHSDNDCLQFNAFNASTEALKPMNQATISRGLKLVLDLHTEDEFNPSLNMQGAIITFSSYGYPYKILERTKSINLQPGQMTFLKLTTKKVFFINSSLDHNGPFQTLHVPNVKFA